MDISTLLENFLSYDDAATITEDVSAILSCPVLVVNSAFKVAACAYPPGFDDALFLGTVHRREMLRLYERARFAVSPPVF